MSQKILKRIAPRYSWWKTGINIYTSASGEVEASVVHRWSQEQGYSQMTFTWKSSGLVVEGWIRDEQQDADGWRATFGVDYVDLHCLPLLPHGTEEVVWGIFVLIEMAGKKTA